MSDFDDDRAWAVATAHVLQRESAASYGEWLQVLNRLADRPDRDDLVASARANGWSPGWLLSAVQICERMDVPVAIVLPGLPGPSRWRRRWNRLVDLPYRVLRRVERWCLTR